MATTPFISVEDAIVNESQGYIDFIVRLNQASVNIVTAHYQTVDGTATVPDSDYRDTSGIITFSPGETIKTVRVQLFSDTDTIPGTREGFQLVLDSPTNAAIGRPIGIGTIVDDYLAPTVVVSASNIVVDEAAGTATFIVSLDQPSLGTVTLDYATANGTALAGSDYTATNGSLTFNPGETAKTVTVNLTQDGAELDESFNLVLSNVLGASLPDATGTAVIAGNAEAATNTLRVENAVAMENAGVIDFIVRLDNPSAQTVTVDFTTFDGTAIAGDYTPQTGTLSFAPGETVKHVQIALTNDIIAEAAEGFRLLLTNPSAGTTLAVDSAVGTIFNDDTVVPVVSIGNPVVDEASGEAVFVITLDRPSAGAVTMNYATQDGSAKATDGDYLSQAGTLTFAAGETVKTVRVAVVNDAVSDPSETFNLVLSSLSGAIAPDSIGTAVIVESDASKAISPTIGVEDSSFGEAQGYTDFVIRLSAPSANVVSVDYSLSGASAVVDNDYIDQSGTLSFAPGETAKTVRVIVKDDYAPTFDETYQLDLKNPVNGTLGRSTGFATIVNDDGYDGMPSITVGDLVVDETTQEAVFTLTLNWPSPSVVTLHYATQDGTALAGSDYQSASGTLSFAPGVVSQTIRVPLLSDVVAENSEYFRLSLTDVVGAAVPDAQSAVHDQGAVAVIVADNVAPAAVPLLNVEDLLIGESQGYADFVVRLSGPGTETVIVNYATTPGSATDSGDFYAQTGTVSFAPGETVKTVRISLFDDTTAETVENFGLSLNTPVNAQLGRSTGVATVIDDDGGTVVPAVSVKNAVVDEKSGEAVFTITLDRPTAGIVSMNYSTQDGSGTDKAEAGSDYIGQTSGIVTFAPGEMAKTVRVALLDDTQNEGSEVFNLVLSNVSGATLKDATGTATLAASDGAAVEAPQISVDDAAVSEGQGYVDFLVRLATPGTQTASVHYSLAAGTAAAGTDYTDQSGTLSFAPGETVKTVRIGLTDDIATEAIEDLKLVLDTPVNAALGRAEATAFIVDNDGVTGEPKVLVSDVAVDEAGREAVFTVTLDRPSTGVVTLDYATGGGTATSGSDYAATAGSLAFAPGEVSKTVRVSLVDDPGQEPSETFNLLLSNVQGGTLGDDTGTATLADNDSGVLSVSNVVIDESNGAATFTVTLDRPSTGTVSVNYATQDGTALAGSDYTAASGTLSFAPGETSKTVTLPVAGNGGDAANETFSLLLSSPLGAVLGNTQGTAVVIDSPAASVVIPVATIEDVVVGEGQGHADFVVRLSAPSVNTVSLPYQLVDHTAVAGSDYVRPYSGQTGTLSFAPGETVKTIRVDILDDADPGELAKSFQLLLSDPANEDFPVPVNATVGRPAAVATILDNDDLAVAPQVSVSGMVVDEMAREAVFTLVLDRASAGRVTLDYATVDGTAKVSDGDYVATAGALSFAPGETVKTVRVPILNDALTEDSETFSLHLANLAGATAPEPDGTTVIARNDAPAANTPTLNVEDTSVGEAQGYAEFVVRLSAPSANLVSVSYSLQEAAAFSPDDYAEQSGILSFAPGETVKTVRISIVDDAGPTFDETFQLDLKNPVNGLLGRSTAFATIVNDDGFEGQPSLSVSDLIVDEASGEAVFVLKLTGPSASPVTLDYATGGGDATAGLDYSATSGHLSFAPGETVKTVRVPILSDGLAEASERFQILLSNVTGAATPNPSGGAPFPVATATLVANGGAVAASPLLSVENLIIGEGQGYADFVVRLDAPSAETVSVSYSTAPGTAEDGGTSGDYWGQTGTLSFAPGEMVKTVRVSLYDDVAAETVEGFRLVLGNPANAGLGQPSGLATVIDNDGAKVIPVATVGDVVVDEATGEAIFTVRLDKPSSGVVSLSYATQDGSATSGGPAPDYVAASGALTFAPGEMAKTVRVALLDDGLEEASEKFSLVLSDVTGATLPVTTGTATLAASDGAPANTPQINVDDVTVSEGQGYVDFLVRLSNPGTQTVSVNYTLAGNTATVGSDYTGQTGTLSFTPGETVKTVRVALVDDTATETIESFKLTLDTPANATLGQATGTATVVDNDGVTGAPVVSVNDISVDEAGREAVFTVTLDRPSTGVVTLDYATGGGTATAGSDYIAATGSLTFGPGEVAKTVRVSLSDDSTYEGGNETFGLTLSNIVGATAADASGTATIIDNDTSKVSLGIDNPLIDEAGKATFTVTLDKASTGTVSVHYQTANGSATGGSDFTAIGGDVSFAPGETSKTVEIQLIDDRVSETSESFTLNLSGVSGGILGRDAATAIITDNDSGKVSVGDVLVDEAAQEAVFTVSLERPSSGTVTLNYTTANGSALAGSDFIAASGSLTFAPGESTKTVKVALVNDNSAESSETFGLALSNIVGASASDASGAAVIAANDGASSVLPLLTVEDVAVGEGQGYAEFVVRLNAPSALPVSVGYSTANGTADATDYLAQTGTLSFASGETVKTVRIELTDDIKVEGGENFQLVLHGPSNAAIGRAAGAAMIEDNEVAGLSIPKASVGDITVDEVSGKAMFTVRLDQPAATEVTIRYATADGTALAGSDYRATSGTLTFALGETEKTIEVQVLKPDLLNPPSEGETDEAFSLNLSDAVGATLPDSKGTATIVHDTPAANLPVIRVESVAANEGQGYVDFFVKLDNWSFSEISVDYKLDKGSAEAGSDFQDQSGTLTFAPGKTETVTISGIDYIKTTPGETVQTVRVYLVDDTRAETPNETFRLVLNNPSNANFEGEVQTLSADATIKDNDPSAPAPTVTISGMVIDEAAGQAIFTLTLDRPTTDLVSLNYTTRDGSAQAGSDYTATSGVLSFAPGETVKTVTVALVNDAVSESSESFDLVLSNPVGALLSDPEATEATAIIAANDGPTATPAITIEDAVANESEGYADFIVRLSGPSAQAVSVVYETDDDDGTAAPNGDYTSQTGTLTFAAGETVQTVRIALVDDAVAETTESLLLRLSNPANATLGDAAGLATVFDDDLVADRPTLSIGDIVVDAASGEATFTLSLDRASTATVTLNYATGGGSAVAGTDYTAVGGTLSFAPGETVKTVKVPLLDNTGPDRDFNLTLANVVGANAPDSAGQAIVAANDANPARISTLIVENALVGEGQGYADFVVRLSAPNSNTITVDYATADGSATAGATGDYLAQTGTLRFAPGETVKTVRVALADDSAHETPEGFQLVLSNPQGFQLPSGIPSNAWLSQSLATATVIDNDLASAAGPTLSIGDVTVDEATGEAVFTLALDRPSSGAVTLDYATGDGGAVAGSDYYASSGTLSFAPGETVKTVRVAILNDTLAETGETFDLKLSNVVGAAAPDKTGIAVIAESDQATGTPVIRVEDASVREGQGYAEFIVRLDAPSANAVTVGYGTAPGTASATSDFLGQTGTLGFAAGETVKTVRVALVDDTAAENTEGFQLVLSGPTNATLDPNHASGSASIADDDMIPVIPVVSISDPLVDEAAREAVFTITLDRPSNGTVAMNYATGGGNAVAGTDYTAASGVLSFAPGETAKTVRIALLDDAAGESSETFNLSLTAVTGATAPDRQGTAVIAANDAGLANTPVISIEDTLVGEGQGYADFIVRLDAPSANTVIVDYQTQNATATVGEDYLGQTGTLSFAPGETVKTVRVWVAEDSASETTEAFQLALKNPQAFDLVNNAPANALLGRTVGTASVIDNDSAADLPTVSVSDMVVDEASGEAVFTVVLHRPSNYTATVSMDYQTSGGTAVAGSDYVAASGQLSFARGETVKTVRVALTDDTAPESAETLGLALSNVIGASAPDPLASAIIAGNDSPAASLPRIGVEDAILGEDQGYVDFVVRLDAPSDGIVGIDYATSPGGASEDSDFIGQSGTLRFAPGETVKILRVAIADDAVAEPTESLQLQLSNPSNGVLGRSTGIATILDQDSAQDIPLVSVGNILIDETTGEAVFTVSLNRPVPSTGIVSMEYATGGGTATAGSDYIAQTGILTFTPGEVAKTVRVTLNNDTTPENSESFFLNLSNIDGAIAPAPSGIAVIAANDAAALDKPRLSVEDTVVGEDQGYADFTIRLDAPGTQTVSVHYVLADGTALAGSAYAAQSGTLSFAPGEMAKTVRVALIDDTQPEPTQGFQITLDTPTNATLSRATGLATLVDNDAATGTPTVTVSDITVDESAHEAVFSLVLNRPSTGTVSLDYQAADGTALAGSDYVAAQGTLAFAPGEVVKTIRVALIDDPNAEPDETFNLNLSNLGGADAASDISAIATIAANDTAPADMPKLNVENSIVGESQGYVDFVVRLDAPSGKPVTVDYTTGDGTATAGASGDYITQSGTLSFAPGETAKTVRVAIVADSNIESSEQFTLKLSNPANAALNQDTATATIIDDGSTAVPVISIADAAVNEQDGNAKLVVTLDKPSLQTVSVDYATVDDTATALGDYTTTTGTLIFKPGETSKEILVPIANDTLPEGEERFGVSLANPTGATLGDATARVSIAASDSNPPVAAADLFIVAEDSGANRLDTLANDDDPDGGTLTITQVSTPTHGTAAIAADGSITYTPSAGYSGEDGFTYTISDSNGYTDTASVAVAVIPSNDPPILATPIPDQTAIANRPFFGYVVTTDTFADPDPGDRLAYSARKEDGSPLPAWLTFDPATRTFSGTPGSGDTGTFNVKVTATDSGFASISDVFAFTVYPTGTASSNAAGNSPPATQNAAASTQEGGAYTFKSADFPFTDPDSGNTLGEIKIDSLPSEGLITLNGQSVHTGQSIARSDIDAGHLAYQAPGTVASEWAQHFAFKVGDGLSFSANASQFTLNIAPASGEAQFAGDSGQLSGKNRADVLIGNDNGVKLNGLGGNDRLYGADGADILKGGTGNDYLSGGSGGDKLHGQAGKDTLVGGAGNDVLDGGAGKDVYRYLAGELGLGDLQAGTHDAIKATKGDTIAFDPSLWSHLTQQGDSLGGLAGQVLGQRIGVGTNIAFDGHSLQIDVNGDGQFQAGLDVGIDIVGVHKVSVDASGAFLLLG